MLNINKFLEKYYKKNEKIIIACSTGPDSMFLLYKILESEYKDNLVVCYFNHKTRKETEDEEKFIEKLGKEKGFKTEITSCDFKKIKKLYPSKSFEELAREKRYAFFNAIMDIYNSNKIITAHHLDDKIETFFFNLSRGTKLSGLINMTEYSGNILRPLLNIKKSTILEYLNKNNLKYFIDNTNFDTEITRNKLRHDIIPLFKKINKNYKENISNCLNYFEELKLFVDTEINKFLSKNKGFFFINEFNQLSPFIQKEVIRYIFYISNGKSTIGLSEANIKEIIKFINGKNNKTIKEIQLLKMKKDNKIILY
ncbi:tRNA lysidine(34) synthetase TilS [Candidatus Gracilibacteria bacterium]|nr:MAG: tRNA lysidine(34) synthetase TilS [Candidatus Gracilibacteria bacterium]PIE85204.1 MAG: tRNA lysidine(34) synthetase TilS [Candidatus Gracilibacteria bacterium]